MNISFRLQWISDDIITMELMDFLEYRIEIENQLWAEKYILKV